MSDLSCIFLLSFRNIKSINILLFDRCLSHVCTDLLIYLLGSNSQQNNNKTKNNKIRTFRHSPKIKRREFSRNKATGDLPGQGSIIFILFFFFFGGGGVGMGF